MCTTEGDSERSIKELRISICIRPVLMKRSDIDELIQYVVEYSYSLLNHDPINFYIDPS